MRFAYVAAVAAFATFSLTAMPAHAVSVPVLKAGDSSIVAVKAKKKDAPGKCGVGKYFNLKAKKCEAPKGKA